jgi:tryptophanyl-tRNA synthetase
MLTTDYADTHELQENIREMVTDWLAAGLDPNKATFFVQSRLPEHAELHLLLSMVTPLGWLERVPTYKEALENIKDRDIHTYGFLGYPVLQAADILMYKADCVPVGEDQVPHVELTREIARRFNAAYGGSPQFSAVRAGAGNPSDHVKGPPQASNQPIAQHPDEARSENRVDDLQRVAAEVRQPIFREPQALLTPTPRLPGTDGRKMSKSYNNAIYLSDPPDVVNQKLAGMMTDPARKRRTDPGNPDVCPVFDLHKVFSSQAVIERVNRECRTAEIGCVDCKKLSAAHLNQRLAPIQERRKPYEENPERVWAILDDGTRRARCVAQATMAEVRKAVNLA